MVKKVIILLCLLIALICTVFKLPIVTDSFGFEYFADQWGTFLATIFLFFLSATGFLFWVGVAAGWKFADNCGFVLLGKIICAILAIYISLPIAIVQLFKSS